MANEQVKLINLAAINASGTSEKALYSALNTDMFFGQQAAVEILIEPEVTAPYIEAPLVALSGEQLQSRKRLLLDECLKTTRSTLDNIANDISLKSITEIIVISSFQDNEDENIKHQWNEVVQETIQYHMPWLAQHISIVNVSFEELGNFTFSSVLNTKYAQPTLVISVDSFIPIDQVDKLSNIITIQSTEGELGVMPSEGAHSALLLPSEFSLNHHESLLTIQPLNTSENNSIKAQLTDTHFSHPDITIHVGTNNEHWVKHWYGQTHHFHHQASKQTDKTVLEKSADVINVTNTLGYLGTANLGHAFAAAQALFSSPLSTAEHAWVVEHFTNITTDNAANTISSNVYRVSKNNT